MPISTFTEIVDKILTPVGFVTLGTILLVCGCPFGVLLIFSAVCLA